MQALEHGLEFWAVLAEVVEQAGGVGGVGEVGIVWQGVDGELAGLCGDADQMFMQELPAGGRGLAGVGR
jgi:hypothetical protein